MSEFTAADRWNSSTPGYYWLRRPKCAGMIAHHGIAKRDGFGRYWIFELKPTGHRFTDLNGFADSEQVIVEDWKSLAWSLEIESRIEQIRARRRPFSLLFWNCEHLASIIWNGKEESKQVKGWGIVAMIILGAFVGAANLKK